MRTVLFVVCFTLGVSLMVFSGYLPKAASARGGSDRGDLHSQAAGKYALYRPVAPPLPERNPDAFIPFDGPSDLPAVEMPASPPSDDLTPDPEPAVAQMAAESTSNSSAASLAVELSAMSDADLPGLNVERLPRADAAPTLSDALENEPESDVADEMTGPPRPERQARPAAELELQANAGEDRVVWAAWNEAVLNGTATTGDQLTFDWYQVAGPRTIEITDATSPLPRVVGFGADDNLAWVPQIYEFELTVRDSAGHESVDRVSIEVRAAPDIKVTPAAERRFEFRDGYLLPHFESWDTNADATASVFQVVSQSELSFTRVAGGAYDIAGGAGVAGGVYLYRISVYAAADQPTSWVELLVDTPERVPAVLQLGVSWSSGVEVSE